MRALPAAALLLVACLSAGAARAGDAGIEALLRAGKLDRALQETLLRVAHDPGGIASYPALLALEPALHRYSARSFTRALRRARGKMGPRHRDALDLVEALRRLTPTADGYHDPLLGRRRLNRLLRESRRPILAAFALWRLARELAPTSPAKALPLLERLLASEGVPPFLRAQARLFLAVNRSRSGDRRGAAEAYRTGLAEHGEVPAPEGGTLEPFFRHGLADVLRAQGKRRAARRELERVVSAELYPARDAARRELEQLG